MRSIKHLPSRLTATLFIGLGLAACSQVQYRAADASKSVATIPFDRMVHFQVARAFYESPPRCAFVLPSQGEAAKSRPGRLIEEAAARQLSFRIERVIGPDRRDQLARKLAIDPTTPKGRMRFAQATRCDTAVEIVTKGLETTFMVVWAQAKLHLAMRLVRARDGKELWRAAHVASRSEGTIPLSPVSFPIGAFSAGRFHGDQDVFPSMADDVTRRIVASLPDTRGASRTSRRRQKGEIVQFSNTTKAEHQTRLRTSPSYTSQLPQRPAPSATGISRLTLRSPQPHS